MLGGVWLVGVSPMVTHLFVHLASAPTLMHLLTLPALCPSLFTPHHLLDCLHPMWIDCVHDTVAVLGAVPGLSLSTGWLVLFCDG